MAADCLLVTTAAITGSSTAKGALGAQGMSGRFQARNQKRAETNQRRERAAEILADVRAFLTEITPDSLGIKANEDHSLEVLRELGERRDRIRVPCSLAYSHPSQKIRVLALQLELEMSNTLRTTSTSSATCSRTRLGSA